MVTVGPLLRRQPQPLKHLIHPVLVRHAAVVNFIVAWAHPLNVRLATTQKKLAATMPAFSTAFQSGSPRYQLPSSTAERSPNGDGHPGLGQETVAQNAVTPR